MKRTTLSIVLVFVLLTSPAARGESSPQAKCGQFLAAIGALGLFVAAQASGGAAAQVANQRGLFESKKAFEARVERNRDRVSWLFYPSLLVTAAGGLVWVTAPRGEDDE